MNDKRYSELCDAIEAVLEKHSLLKIIEHRKNVKFAKNQFIAFCWSIFHASKYDVTCLYNDGLHDSHIETALKRILSDFE